jgi:hypothetical protein
MPTEERIFLEAVNVGLVGLNQAGHMYFGWGLLAG